MFSTLLKCWTFSNLPFRKFVLTMPMTITIGSSIVGILVVWKLNAKIDRGCVVACSAATVSGNAELRDYLQENACKRLEHWQG